ncbi:DedA family protein [Alteribacillus sp. HJP-4]|uniref:DedA family protein n=1 Tax=Alteribacillus sp. HJP-4 TaxID=2775394 RepID=UPI0035CD057B
MLELILETLKQLGFWGLLIGIGIEALSVPFPAAIVFLVYGYIMEPSGWSWLFIGFGSAAAYTAVAFIPYWLSLRYDHLLQKRVNSAGAQRMLKFMDKYREWTITAGRILGMGYIVYVAAFSRISPLRYAFFTFIGVLPVAVLMFYLGSLGNIEAVYTWFQNIQYIITVVIIGLLTYYVYYRIKRRSKYRSKENQKAEL